MDPCYLRRLPLEIFDAIALELTALEPVGPPSILLPLMLTCKALHALLVPQTNPALYARVFRQKFDVAAVTRRAFRPTPIQCVDQMHQYFAALRVFRRRDLYPAAAPGEEMLDIDVEAALQIGVVMMLEDDGKNAMQLVQWGHADEFVDSFVRTRLYEDAEENDGWPLESSRNAHALWLMWLLTTEESLLKESPTRRAQLMQLLLPFVYVPYRYPGSLAPPNHYLIPPLITPTHAPSTIPTAHGAYPIYPDPAFVSFCHYSSRPQLARPLASVAAKLLFCARTEVTPVPIPPHLDRTREDAHARGNWEVGPTREDVEEFNWGWTARLPGGRAWARGVLDWAHEAEDEDEDGAEGRGAERPRGQVFEGFEPPEPVSRWVGKAPHAGEYAARGRGRGRGRALEKSAKWDADWFRMRMCGDMMRVPPRVPYGRVFEPLSLVGLWHGRMLVPGEQEIQNLINNPIHPPHGVFTEEALAVQLRPMYVRLRELHGVVGEVAPSASASACKTSTRSSPSTPPSASRRLHAQAFALGAPEDHDGMNDAWFAAPPRVSAYPPGEERVQLGVGGKRGVYRCRRCPAEGGRRGNEAFEGLGRAGAGEGEGQGGEEGLGEGKEGEWEGYEHEEGECVRCWERREFRRRLAMGRGEGLLCRSPSRSGSGSEAGSEDEGEEGEEEEDEDALMMPWDGDETVDVDGEGNRVKEVVVVGEPDPAHAAAFHAFHYHGRIRPWDGLVLLVRTPARSEDAFLGQTLFYGYLVGRDTVVGNWRIKSADPGVPAWEGVWCMSRRED
ncbi:putative imidazolonepropionase activity [Lyophyllum shimeji]|uniref:Imidazolonepropionase activity n=1 Tax=Lyophyllum shimeji TaxID=47721 RepID=A0A9P3PVK0_LYOSH|nr:putative imidazolonepropionase activity [Lyophyllum shimeji]